MPALAIAEGLRARRPDLEPVLVGAMRGIEATLLPTRDFRHYLLPAEPLYRRQWWKNVRWPFVFAGLMRGVRDVFRREQPALVIGTGGYASAPVVWHAVRRRIPCAVQEQNAFPGLANRWLARRVNEVWLGLPEARAHLAPGPHTILVDTGNPILAPTPQRREAAARRFAFPPGRPVVLVTGGSQGAFALNRVVAAWVQAHRRTPPVNLLWVTGRATYSQFASLHRPQGAVQVVDFLDPMADGYAIADLVVGRAGMLTVAELCAWGLPSILVPLPTAAADHQTLNAKALAAAGAADWIPQHDLTPATLGAAIDGILADARRRAAMAAAARARGRPEATAVIVERALGLIDERGMD